MPANEDNPDPQPQVFATTHWSMVIHAGNSSSPRCTDALEELCRTYWYPLYTCARRCGEKAEAAQDLTQAFFARLLERNFLHIADRKRGKFRWFLLASFKHFLANEWDRARAQKRGGGKQLISLDSLDAEERYRLEPSHSLTADVLYERRWALTLLGNAREALGTEFAQAGKADRFAVLEQYLPGQEPGLTHAEAARELDSTEGAVKVEVLRLKKRYGEVRRAEVAAALFSPAGDALVTSSADATVRYWTLQSPTLTTSSLTDLAGSVAGYSTDEDIRPHTLLGSPRFARIQSLFENADTDPLVNWIYPLTKSD